MEKLTIQNFKELFAVVADVFAENCEYLCSLDAQMGDGDLGLTMKKGFAAVSDALANMDEPVMGRLLMKAGMKMSSVVPSTMGTLMSSGLMSAGKALGDCQELGAKEYVLFLNGYCDGIVKRGKCIPGDRTILDALDSARQAAAGQAEKTNSLEETVRASLIGAERGVEATKQMRPKFGKAVVFSAKSSDMADQGAIAGMLFIRAIHTYICR